MIVTCSTPGCMNQSLAVEVPDGAEAVYCGPCGQPILGGESDER